MDKRFQVFVSSTFEDLRVERATVIKSLLELDCFPAGMELFPAADEDSLSLIKSVINDSDYHLTIVGGRYGSIHEPSGKSFTQLEYEYALESGKPTIALIHSKPNLLPMEKSEATEDGRQRLEAFRNELRKKNCRLWADPGELTAAVFTGVQNLKRTRSAVGWIKASSASGEALKDELISVRRQLDATQAHLDKERQRLPPPGSDGFASGSEKVDIVIMQAGSQATFELTWNKIIRSVLPACLGGGAEERALANVISSLAMEEGRPGYGSRLPGEGVPEISRHTLSKVMAQLIALGLVRAIAHPQQIAGSIWIATPYGAHEGCKLVAQRTEK